MHKTDFCREVHVTAQSVCRRRSLLRRSLWWSAGILFYLSPWRSHGRRPPCRTDGFVRRVAHRVRPRPSGHPNKRRALPVLVWDLPRKDRNRLAYALHGNSAAQGLPRCPNFRVSQTIFRVSSNMKKTQALESPRGLPPGRTQPFCSMLSKATAPWANHVCLFFFGANIFCFVLS